ncbi:universal stress protein [Nocardia otitidiscaviarum]|uniref:universal stress protein n=1 Tax=Nocardia otitidiscaviarum TaxID=1823 RepID=UPI00189474CA|nr:universal stress protein [Nocardia otitidiscaviarum]MBF6132437.1 universal stress protein [Nocardia otitidiscaviarum]
MNFILARSSEPVPVVAACLAKVMEAALRPVPADFPDDELMRALDDPDVVLGVVGNDDGVWKVLRRCSIPLVVVPPRTAGEYGLGRVLVPLDGTEEAAHAVSATVRLLGAGGVEIVVLHVFDRTTVPAHWDQAAHARDAWESEFVARFCNPYFPGLRQTMTLRSGVAGDTIVDVAAEQADMIVLGWSRQLLPGHAESVRTAVAAASVPVMVVPIGDR